MYFGYFLHSVVQNHDLEYLCLLLCSFSIVENNFILSFSDYQCNSYRRDFTSSKASTPHNGIVCNVGLSYSTNYRDKCKNKINITNFMTAGN